MSKSLSQASPTPPTGTARRGNHEGSLRQRSGRWQVRVQVDGHTVTGTAATKAEAIRLLHKLASRGAIGVPAPEREEGPTVGEWLARWQELCGSEWKPATAERYRDVVRLQLLPAIGHRPLAALTAADITACLAACRGVSASTRLKVYRVLSRALTVAVYHGLLEKNPCAGVEPPRARRTPPTLWTRAEAARFVASLPSAPYGPLWAILLGSGCRLGEALALRWADYDAATGAATITATHTETRGWQGRTSPKTLAGYRTVTLPGFARALLANCPEAAPNDPLFVNSHGSTPTRALARYAFLRACEAAQVPALRVHDLRHLHASLLLSEGVGLPVVAARLGHASTAVTASVYAHALGGSAAVCAEVLAAALG